jgi:hypothetical protein
LVTLVAVFESVEWVFMSSFYFVFMNGQGRSPRPRKPADAESQAGKGMAVIPLGGVPPQKSRPSDGGGVQFLRFFPRHRKKAVRFARVRRLRHAGALAMVRAVRSSKFVYVQP